VTIVPTIFNGVIRKNYFELSTSSDPDQRSLKIWSTCPWIYSPTVP